MYETLTATDTPTSNSTVPTNDLSELDNQTLTLESDTQTLTHNLAHRPHNDLDETNSNNKREIILYHPLTLPPMFRASEHSTHNNH